MREIVETGYVLGPGRSVILKLAQSLLLPGGVVMLIPGNVQSALEYLMNLPALLSSAASCSFAFLPAYASANLQQMLQRLFVPPTSACHARPQQIILSTACRPMHPVLWE